MKTPKELTAELYERFKLSDAEIAKRVGSSQPTIWRLRNGRTENCMSGLLNNLAGLHEELSSESSEDAQVAARREAA